MRARNLWRKQSLRAFHEKSLWQGNCFQEVPKTATISGTSSALVAAAAVHSKTLPLCAGTSRERLSSTRKTVPRMVPETALGRPSRAQAVQWSPQPRKLRVQSLVEVYLRERGLREKALQGRRRLTRRLLGKGISR